MSKMEKNISFQVFALLRTNKKEEKSPENELLFVFQKKIFPICRSGFPEAQFRVQITKKQPQVCATNRFEAVFYGAREGT